MKRQIVLMICVLLLVGCTNTTTDTKGAAEPIEIGSGLEQGATEMTPVLAGDMSNQDVWKKFVQAANDENLEIMTELEAEDIEIYGSDGSVMKGSKNHIDYCREWFKASDPNWQIRLMIANAGKNKDGNLDQWLTTSADYTDTDEDGKEVLEQHMYDVNFENGKIKKIVAYTKKKSVETPE